MEIEKININKLNPAPYNPRIMPTAEMEKLKKGLTTYGLIDPIIIDLTDNNTVIGGHQRLEALKEIDIEEELTLIKLGDVGLVLKETDLKIKDKNQQKAMNLALNKIQGDWDYGLLDDLLVELNEAHYDIDLTGFEMEDISLNTDFDISELFDESEEPDEELPPDLREVQGEQPGHQYVVHLSFPTKEAANNYLQQIGVTKEMDKTSMLLFFEKDFTNIG